MAFVFTANNGTNGFELWISDGTAAGTKLLKDINTTTAGAYSTPYGFYGFKGKIYFAANNGIDGYELWVTDGTAAGTKLVKDINDGSTGSVLDPLFAPLYTFTTLNGKMLFGANGGDGKIGVWASDGTEAGTTLVKAVGGTLSG